MKARINHYILWEAFPDPHHKVEFLPIFSCLFILLSNKYSVDTFLNGQTMLGPRDTEREKEEDMALALKDLLFWEGGYQKYE